MTDAAIIFPQGTSYSVDPDKSAIATGTVRTSSNDKKVKANKNSFQAAMNVNNPTETKAGHITGMITLKIIFKTPAPSTRAACSNSIGKSLKKVVITQTVNGIEKII